VNAPLPSQRRPADRQTEESSSIPPGEAENRAVVGVDGNIGSTMAVPPACVKVPPPKADSKVG